MSLAIEPKRLGLIFFAVYAAAIALIVLFVVTVGGHMSSLLLVFPALPWPLLGRWLHRGWGLPIGTFAGLALNAVLVYAAGYGIGWLLRRRRHSERNAS